MLRKKLSETEIHFWRFAICLWAFATLSFMAGMSIGGAIFNLTSFYLIYRAPQDPQLLRFLRSSAFTKASLALVLASLLSFAYCFLVPPLGIHPVGAGEFMKLHYYLYPFMLCFALVTCGVRFWPILDSTAWLMACIGIFQFWAPLFLPSHWIHGAFFRQVSASLHCHAQGLMMFHLSFASAMCFPASYALARFLWRNPSQTRCRWLMYGALALVCCLAVFFSYSRIAWIAIFALVVALSFLRKPRFGLLAMGLMLVLGGGVWLASPGVRFRLQDNSFGTRERKMVWLSSLEMIRDRPILGVGFGKTGQYSEAYELKAFGVKQDFASHSHNNWIDSLASTGILGFLSFLFWWGVLFFYSFQQFRAAVSYEKWLPAACIAAGIAFQVNGITQVNFYDAKSEHALMFWAGLVLYQEWQRRKAASTTLASGSTA